jgi:preprotein translocase subunit SecG
MMMMMMVLMVLVMVMVVMVVVVVVVMMVMKDTRISCNYISNASQHYPARTTNHTADIYTITALYAQYKLFS